MLPRSLSLLKWLVVKVCRDLREEDPRLPTREKGMLDETVLKSSEEGK